MNIHGAPVGGVDHVRVVLNQDIQDIEQDVDGFGRRGDTRGVHIVFDLT
jgi:hypothetical protein